LGEGYILPELLESPIELNNATDFEKLINAHWYVALSMTNTKVGNTVFKSCRDYFDQAIDETYTSKASEIGAYLEFKMMCEATRMMQFAKNAEFNFLPDLVLTENLPSVLPKSVALQTSVTEANRSSKNKALVYWSDITPITKYESKSKQKSTYYHNGGYQELEVVGTGDVSSDNVQDILVLVRDYIEGGSYFNIRLLVFSVDSNSNWKLIDEF